MTTFIIGAGFGVEARRVAGSIRGRSLYLGEYEIDCRYPLVGDLPGVCYPDSDAAVASDEIEDRLAQSISDGDWEPVKRLCESLQKADYYLAPRLVGNSGLDNPYRDFFSEFSGSSFINFNYDSFVEFALSQQGTWSPDGGFGVPVGFEVSYTVQDFEVVPATSLVLHPHGSLLVYTRDFSFGPPDRGGIRWMQHHDPAHFMFDPHAVGHLFYPFTRVTTGLGYDEDLGGRVIAPVPDKAEGLRSEFVAGVMERAAAILAQEDLLVSIGYAFSPLDEGSYTPLLEALGQNTPGTLLVVSPEPTPIVERLVRSFPGIEVRPQALGFTAWVEAGYPGLG